MNVIPIDTGDELEVCVVRTLILKMLDQTPNNRFFRLYIVFLKPGRMPRFGITDYEEREGDRIGLATPSEIEQKYSALPTPKKFSKTEVRPNDVAVIRFIKVEDQVAIQFMFHTDNADQREIPWNVPYYWDLTDFSRLVIVANRTQFSLLTQKGFDMFCICGSHITSNYGIFCTICYDLTPNHIIYDCGHTACVKCDASWKRCSACNSCKWRMFGKIYDGPCPIDQCTLEKGQRPHALHPCGCVIPHASQDDIKQFLRNQKKPYKNRCPYEFCRTANGGIVKIYQDFKDLAVNEEDDKMPQQLDC